MNEYSVDFKLKIVKMILNDHISKKSIMREYNVATKTQRQWIHKYQTEGISGLLTKRKIRDKIPTNQEVESIESLKHEILMLKVEIERLKKGYSSEDVKYLKKNKS
ncbi:MAG: helix-turn-helix domain containing protein [Acholeplasmataceae bacterium]|nr:helix-turn-helix domain containing protein [Acholeplasmataceae bacterium]MDY0339478.1 helix-turn-helix domain-containing protein [Acholeplasmataceae bacterium]